jgi:hypothetical protein
MTNTTTTFPFVHFDTRGFCQSPSKSKNVVAPVKKRVTCYHGTPHIQKMM